jgi:hypothetical protein
MMPIALSIGGDCDPGRALLGAGVSSGLEEEADGVCWLVLLVLVSPAWLLFLGLVLIEDDDILLFLFLSHSGVHSTLTGVCPPGGVEVLGGVVGGIGGVSSC